MRKELDDRLCREFPTLFKDRHADMRATCMCWGFACGDGWFNLIHQLCKDIVAIAPDTVATQVKEKFGGLRFYIFSAPEEVHDLIGRARVASLKICEQCGQPGKPNEQGWIRTLCDECRKKRGE